MSNRNPKRNRDDIDDDDDPDWKPNHEDGNCSGSGSDEEMDVDLPSSEEDSDFRDSSSSESGELRDPEDHDLDIIIRPPTPPISIIPIGPPIDIPGPNGRKNPPRKHLIQPKKKKIEKTKISIPIDTQINNLADLIKLAEMYDEKYEYDCVINIETLHNMLVPLKKLHAMIGMESFKNALINQIIFQLTGLRDKDRSKGDPQMLHTVLLGSPGTGKCLSFGTLVRMYDGSIKPVQDIKVGELIMGDDSTARKILSITNGQEQMYRIDQGYGDSYTVNESHILSLKLSKNPRIRERTTQQSYQVVWFSKENRSSKTFSWRESSKETAYQAAKSFTETLPKKGSIIDICVKDYLKKPSSWKTGYKGYKVGIDYPKQEVTIDPYLLGAWLGDGTQITGIDHEIIDAFKKEYPELGVRVDKTGITYHFTSGKCGYPGKNPFLNQLKKYNLIKNKHIPSDYLINDRETRLQLLAGLIDTDGHYTRGLYEITQKRVVLADNIRELARSLGFRATTTKCEKSCTYKGEKRTGTYYRTHISGHLDTIPVKLQRKQAHPRKQIKDPLVYGITVTPTKVDNYYGFEIDGNRRFVLGDFTVTHNTTVAQIFGELYAKMGILSRGHFTLAKRADLIAKYLGQTAPKTLKVLEGARGGVLLIDEVYSLGPPHGDDDSFSKECIDTINQFLSENADDFICIIAGYKEEVEKSFFSRNPGLSRRFPYRYTIEGYKPNEMLLIFQKFINDSDGWSFAESPDRPVIDTTFFQANKDAFPCYGGDLKVFFDNCKISHARRTFIMPPDHWKKLTREDIDKGFELYKTNKELGVGNEIPESVRRLYL